MPSLSLILFNLGFLGVLGVIVPIGILTGMVSLIFGPITIRSGVLLSLVSLGRIFGKLKVPKRIAFFMWTAVHGRIML